MSAENQVESSTEVLWHRFKQNRVAMWSSIFLIFVLLFCWVGPLLVPYGQEQTDLEYKAQGPSMEHWLGSDVLGRDLATRMMYGGRISLMVGLLTTLVSMFIGIVYGGLAGWLGKRWDSFIMRVVDVMYAFPLIILVIILTLFFDKNVWLQSVAETLHLDGKLLLLFIAIGSVEWLTMARLVRSLVIHLKVQDFVICARAGGAGFLHLMRWHFIPNLMGPVLVYASLMVPSVMILEATLSFLGLGVQPPYASWGSLILDGASSLESYPWLLIFPATLFSLTLLSLNLVGDALQEALDPKFRRK